MSSCNFEDCDKWHITFEFVRVWHVITLMLVKNWKSFIHTSAFTYVNCKRLMTFKDEQYRYVSCRYIINFYFQRRLSWFIPKANLSLKNACEKWRFLWAYVKSWLFIKYIYIYIYIDESYSILYCSEYKVIYSHNYLFSLKCGSI